MGFGLNVAPSIIKSVLAKVLSQYDTIQQAISPYLDDVIANEDWLQVNQLTPSVSVQAYM